MVKNSFISTFNLMMVLKVGLCFLGVTVLVITSLGFLSKWAEFSLDRDPRLDEFYQRAEQIKHITLGASQATSIHFPSLVDGAYKKSGYNFFSPGMDYFQSSIKLRAILPYTPNLKCVFVAAMPGGLRHNNDRHDPKTIENLSRYRFMPAILPEAPIGLYQRFRITYYDIKYRFLARRQAVAFLIADKLKSVFRDYLEPDSLREIRRDNRLKRKSGCQKISNPKESPNSDGFKRGYRKTPGSQQCLETWAIKAANSHNSKIKGGWLEEKRNLNILEEMADLLAHRNAHLVLFTPPLSQHYLARRSYRDFGDVASLRSFASQNSNVTLHRYESFFRDHEKATKNLYFFDADHLTEAGARKFTSALIQEVPQCGA